MQVENCTAKHMHVHVHIHVSEYHNIQTHTDSLQELFNCHIHIEPNEGLFTTWSLAVLLISSHAIMLCEGFG